MHDEAGFLSAIRQTPADDTARLVFADWLDEQDDPTCKTKAAFLRLELRMANGPEADCSSLTNQLQRLAVPLDPDWLVVVSSPKIRGCTTRLDRECPAVWSRLVPTYDPCARNCAECRSTVRYARTRDELLEYAWRGYRTAATVALVGADTAHAPGRWCPIGAAVTQEPLIERSRLPCGRDERCPDRQELADAIAESDETEPTADAKPSRRPRRQNGRDRNRNIQRDNWEDAE
jgi:uncharacterized protein (TIGR02996 family)